MIPTRSSAPSKSSRDQRRPEFRPWTETLAERGLRANDTRQLTIDASRLASGTYFLRVTGESFRETRRMAIVR